MIMPSGVNKAMGLAAALDELHLSSRDTVGVGDAENDHDFLDRCAVSVAVAHALPMVQERADLVTRGGQGKGVVDLINRLIEDDLSVPAPGRDRTGRSVQG